MGVLLRVAPLAPGASQRSPWLAHAQAARFLTGAAGMVAHFALGRWAGLTWSAVCVLAASLGTIYGCLRAWGADWGFVTAQVPLLSRLGAHLLLAAGGWVGTLILGLQLELLPATAGPRPLVLLRFVLWQGGLLCGSACLLGGLPGLPWALGAVALAAALQLMGPLARLRRQRGSAGDLVALLLLIAAAVAALLESLDLPADGALRLRLVHATGYALLLGFGPLTVASAATKLFPLFVWQERFAPDIGRKPVPPVAALASPRLRDAAVGTLTLGLLVAAGAIVAEHEVAAAVGAWIVFGGALLLVAGFARTASWALLKREWKGRDGRNPRPARGPGPSSGAWPRASGRVREPCRRSRCSQPVPSAPLRR